MKYLLASFNPSKLREIKSILPETFEIVCLADIPGAEEPEEDGDTLEANAKIKAEYGYRLTGLPTIADDTGLLVEALNGRPGVYSARYAGEPSNAERNMQKLLEELQAVNNRNAEFRTVITLMQNDGNLMYFTGVLKGEIADAPRGTHGFGYDPVFIPEGDNRTLGAYSSEEKNKISHRAKALEKLATYLERDKGINS
jgi:XTP/dITP diphosphohydrolase